MPMIIDPKTTTRAMAFELWMKAPNPMVTFFKTLGAAQIDAQVQAMLSSMSVSTDGAEVVDSTAEVG